MERKEAKWLCFLKIFSSRLKALRDQQQPRDRILSARAGELNIYKRLVKGSSQMHFTGFKPIYKRVLRPSSFPPSPTPTRDYPADSRRFPSLAGLSVLD